MAVGAERMKSSALLAAAAKGTVPWWPWAARGTAVLGRWNCFFNGNSDGNWWDLMGIHDDWYVICWRFDGYFVWDSIMTQQFRTFFMFTAIWFQLIRRVFRLNSCDFHDFHPGLVKNCTIFLQPATTSNSKYLA